MISRGTKCGDSRAVTINNPSLSSYVPILLPYPPINTRPYPPRRVPILLDATATPPEIKIEGTGLEARVKVGGRSVRFDGERLVISDAK